MGADSLDRERIERIVRAMPALVGTAEGAPSPDEISWPDLLDDYFRVMEIAHYVRRGGVKAMIYRVETGRAQLAPSDYFDEAHQKLSAAFRDLYTPHIGDQSVLDRLAAVTPEEEDCVRELLPKIDEILLAEKRKEAALSEE